MALDKTKWKKSPIQTTKISLNKNSALLKVLNSWNHIVLEKKTQDLLPDVILNQLEGIQSSIEKTIWNRDLLMKRISDIENLHQECNQYKSWKYNNWIVKLQTALHSSIDVLLEGHFHLEQISNPERFFSKSELPFTLFIWRWDEAWSNALEVLMENWYNPTELQNVHPMHTRFCKFMWDYSAPVLKKLFYTWKIEYREESSEVLHSVMKKFLNQFMKWPQIKDLWKAIWENESYYNLLIDTFPHAERKMKHKFGQKKFYKEFVNFIINNSWWVALAIECWTYLVESNETFKAIKEQNQYALLLALLSYYSYSDGYRVLQDFLYMWYTFDQRETIHKKREGLINKNKISKPPVEKLKSKNIIQVKENAPIEESKIILKNTILAAMDRLIGDFNAEKDRARFEKYFRRCIWSRKDFDIDEIALNYNIALDDYERSFYEKLLMDAWVPLYERKKELGTNKNNFEEKYFWKIQKKQWFVIDESMVNFEGVMNLIKSKEFWFITSKEHFEEQLLTLIEAQSKRYYERVLWSLAWPRSQLHFRRKRPNKYYRAHVWNGIKLLCRENKISLLSKSEYDSIAPKLYT